MNAETFIEKPLERFDIVLVRRPEFKPDDRTWIVSTFDRLKEAGGKRTYLCGGVWYLDCIQYRYNEELTGTDGEPKAIQSLKWGELVQAANEPQGPWLEAVLLDFTEGNVLPWTVLCRNAAEEALKSGNQPSFVRMRHLRRVPSVIK